LPQIRFPTAKHYIQEMHPEYDFVFTLEEKALTFWGYGPERAREIQSDLLAVVCAHGRKMDAAKGITIIIEDESCETGPATVWTRSV
jgi:hypothetical protein